MRRSFWKLVVVGALVWGWERGRGVLKSYEEKKQRQEQLGEQQLAERREWQQKESETRMIARNCEIAFNNRQVLHDASEDSQIVLRIDEQPDLFHRVVGERGGTNEIQEGNATTAPKTAWEIQTAYDEAQRFIDENCADEAKRRRDDPRCRERVFSQQLACQG